VRCNFEIGQLFYLFEDTNIDMPDSSAFHAEDVMTMFSLFDQLVPLVALSEGDFTCDSEFSEQTDSPVNTGQVGLLPGLFVDFLNT
jgi:hypothetical protein